MTAQCFSFCRNCKHHNIVTERVTALLYWWIVQETKEKSSVPVVNQTKETVTTAPDQKATSTTSIPQKRRAIYIVLHVSTIKIGQLVGKASAPVKVHKYNPTPTPPSQYGIGELTQQQTNKFISWLISYCFEYITCKKCKMRQFHVIGMQWWQEMYEKAWRTCKVVLLLIKPIVCLFVFLLFSVLLLL